MAGFSPDNAQLMQDVKTFCTIQPRTDLIQAACTDIAIRVYYSSLRMDRGYRRKRLLKYRSQLETPGQVCPLEVYKKLREDLIDAIEALDLTDAWEFHEVDFPSGDSPTISPTTAPPIEEVTAAQVTAPTMDDQVDAKTIGCGNITHISRQLDSIYTVNIVHHTVEQKGRYAFAVAVDTYPTLLGAYVYDESAPKILDFVPVHRFQWKDGAVKGDLERACWENPHNYDVLENTIHLKFWEDQAMIHGLAGVDV